MTTNQINLQLSHDASLREACGWIFIGPNTTASGRCKGVYFSIHPKDPLGRALIDKGIRHVQISAPASNPDAVQLRGTFKNHSPRSFRLRHSDNDLMVELGTREVPENVASRLKIHGYLDVRGELSADGVLTVQLPN